jgi:hypothetical protein
LETLWRPRPKKQKTSGNKVEAPGIETADDSSKSSGFIGASPLGGATESLRLETVGDDSRPLETIRGAEPTDAEFERAIIAAMLDGRGDVAELLAGRLNARQAARVPENVVAIGTQRRGNRV